MIKNNYIVFLLIVALGMSCNLNEWDAPMADPSHHAVFTSEQDFENRVEIGGKISFGDISRGVSSRTWTIPEGWIYSNDIWK